MTTDRELLERAAKAAGIKLHVWGTPGAENFADVDAKPYGRLWNPLTDDGDALRLAVKLGIDTGRGIGNQRWAVHYAGSKAFHESCERDGIQDAYAAARRAIVRAAAALAQHQQEKTG